MRRFRMVGLVLLVPGLMWLTGCNLFPSPSSTLKVSPGSVSLDSGTRSASVSLENTSNAAVAWTATVSDTQHLTISQSYGNLAAGASQSLTVTIDYYGLSRGQVIKPTVTFDGGSAGKTTLAVDFTMTIGGLAQCGTLPSTLALKPTAGTLSVAQPPARATLPDGRAYVPGQLLVAYAAGVGIQGSGGRGTDLATMAAAVKADYGLTVLRAGGSGAPDLVRVSDAPATLARMRGDPRVRDVELNLYLKPLLTPNDTWYSSSQWTMQEFGLEQAWNTETGSSNRTVIAVIDDGVQLDHPDLQAKVIGGCDLNEGDNDPSPGPGQSHGTHVAGIAAAIGNNNQGVAGVAWGKKVFIEPVKVFDDAGGNATIDTLVNAIRWAAGLHVPGVADNPNPADVINMSVGVAGTSVALDQAATDAFANGSLLVAAAGNHQPGATNTAVMTPANAPDVIAVGSVDSDYGISNFSNYDDSSQTLSDGTGVELMAPGGFEVSGAYTAGYCPRSYLGSTIGVTVVSTYPGDVSTFPQGAYGCDVGTSMASPFVAGIAALLKSQTPSLTPGQLRAALDNAVKPGSAPDPTEYGYGVVCADKAVDPTGLTTCGQ